MRLSPVLVDIAHMDFRTVDVENREPERNPWLPAVATNLAILIFDWDSGRLIAEVVGHATMAYTACESDALDIAIDHASVLMAPEPRIDLLLFEYGAHLLSENRSTLLVRAEELMMTKQHSLAGRI